MSTRGTTSSRRSGKRWTCGAATYACESLEGLKAADFVERLVSEVTGEWMYVFKPSVGGIPIYVKVILRRGCVVVSFHEDEGGDDEERH